MVLFSGIFLTVPMQNILFNKEHAKQNLENHSKLHFFYIINTLEIIQVTESD